MALYNSVVQLVGNTPMLNAANYCAAEQTFADIFVKLEYFNPSGSVKDRIALAMIEEAERSGKLKKGGVIIEPTSGNTSQFDAFIFLNLYYSVLYTGGNISSLSRIYYRILDEILFLVDK